MNVLGRGLLYITLWMAALSGVSAGAVETAAMPWKACLRQAPGWYQGGEAVRIGDNVLLYQRDTGGWPKNIEMAPPLDTAARQALVAQKKQVDSTIDNDATYTQMEFLARVYDATRLERFRDGFLKGLDYLLAAQYENGGWPQFYPGAKGYHRHITFNDDAMIGVMDLLREVAQKTPPYGFVDEKRRVRAGKAVEKGITCILKCQVVVGGKRTAWCAQHDERTLAPAPGRAYEKISLSGGESVGIVGFLMGIERPGPEVIAAIQAAVGWFERVKLTGLREVHRPDPALPKGYDTVIVPDPAAPPLWARFYEIGTNRPIFCGRDGVVRYSLAEIEYERRNGYRWVAPFADTLLARDYPQWRARWEVGGHE